MYKILCTLLATAGILFAQATHAQDKDAQPKKKKKEVVISNRGIIMRAVDSAKKAGSVDTTDNPWSSSASMDFGVNFLQDNTNYVAPKTVTHLNGSGVTNATANLFDLKQNKSININLYWLKSYRALKTKGQRIYISSGLGMQFYNFRFKENITYNRNPYSFAIDSVAFSKNKLAFNYLNVPLMVTFKTRLWQNKAHPKKDAWLVYGGGITAGYAISIWTKQVSGERGKVKVHDEFDFNRFNSCVTGEIGIEGVIRLYGTYQLTNLYNNGFDMHPISLGIKISGI
ncbi:MAG: hypothetical protein H7257_13325 [Taibaiella sp.]|nr:hypothetical protein [Taibaiella sp.]